MDHHLAALVRNGRITYETAAERCHSVDELNRLMGRAGGGGM
jgi:twitching motility protein PilT